MKKFEQGVLNTTEQNDVNSLIMEKASDIAGELTEQACKIKGVACFTEPDEDNDGMTSYTEEAQDMFNSFYDTKMDELYELVNGVQAIVEEDAGQLTLEEMELELKEVKSKILIDLKDTDNVDYKEYMKHIGEETILLKYIDKLKMPTESIQQ